MRPRLPALLLALAVVLAPARAHASAPAEEPILDVVLKGLNLALVLGVLVWFGREPIRRFFADRRRTISAELGQASTLLADAERKYAEWERRMAGLDAELEQIRQQARARAESERERILADAAATAERVRRDATAALDQELRRARAELRAEAGAMAITMAGRLLQERMTPSDGDRLIDEFVTRLEEPTPDARRRV